MRLPRIIMGCGHSTFNLIEEGMACAPKRRMVESHAKNDLLDNNDPSTKQLLLKDGGEAAPNNHARNASSDSVVMKEPPQMRVEREKGERGVMVSKCESGTEKDETDDDECERAKDDDFGRRISDFDGDRIGSPSFREYCVDSESDYQDAVNHGRDNDKEKKKKKKTQGTSENLVCVFPGEKCLEKKESRGRKFTKVFPAMHRPKNLWHVATRNSRNNHHIPSDKLPEKEALKDSEVASMDIQVDIVVADD